MHEATTHLSQRLRRVSAGEEVVILRGRQPVARLVPVRPWPRALGLDRGLLHVPCDVDDPLPERARADVER